LPQWKIDLIREAVKFIEGEIGGTVTATTDAINASETDCLAGHVGLELGNPCASHVSEIS
jgi:hypothetical protein